MEQILERSAEKFLTDSDIKKILLSAMYEEDNCPPVIAYHQLSNIDDIDELFTRFSDKPTDAIVIVYERERNSGHYTCIIKHKDGNGVCYEFFDSYGTNHPDSELRYSDYNAEFENRHSPLYNHSLFYLLKGHRWISNNYKFQLDNPNYGHFKDNTCGRQVACRIIFKHLDLKKYYDLFKNCKEISLEITKMTLFLI